MPFAPANGSDDVGSGPGATESVVAMDLTDDPAFRREELEPVHLLRSVDVRAAEGLLRGCPVRALREGEILIAAEQANGYLYVLLAGTLGVHLRSPEAEPIVLLEAGESVGELSLIDRRLTSAFVVAKTPCRVLVIEESLLWTLVKSFHAVSNNLLFILSTRLRYDNDLIHADRQQLRQRLQELEREHEALRRSEARYQALYDLNPSMFFTVDTAGTVLSTNHFGADQLGYAVEDLVGTPVWALYPEEDRPTVARCIEGCLSDQSAVHRWEVRKVRRDGSQLWVRETARSMVDPEGRPAALIVCEDITESHRLSEQLFHEASHDALTGLVNRRVFEQRLQRVLATAQAEKTEHALCYLDLDQFKLINDACGHVAGDELLRQLSALLQGVVRKRDTVARLGGDEFGILLERCPLENGKRVAGAVCKAIEDFRFVWEGRSFGIGVSIGLVHIDEASEGVASVLRAADAACYAAKDSGRNRIHVYRHDDAAVARRRGEMRWVTRLNQALDENRLFFEFQPIVGIGPAGAEEGAHYELLLRLRDEDGRTVLPGTFLPAVERYNLSVRLDGWVVATALEWLRRHPAHLQRLHLCAINLSGLSLADEGFLGLVVRRFQETGVPPSKICFEITETAAITHLSSAMAFIKAVKALGCRFALDDFGSGLSSFAYLKFLPVDFLKISGVFTRDILSDGLDLAIVKSISEVGRAIGTKTVAEWVESEAVLARLTRPDLGIDYVQGFSIGRPQPLFSLG